ncbi:hypothetical protein L1887_14863 [Cichorium endivia]|nr:hypothetical protein L1887_14863 [Cichorium endivia]
MEWNTKWEWENFDMFNSKSITSPKRLDTAYWNEEGEDIDGSFNNLSGNISSTDQSSFKDGLKGSSSSFGCFPYGTSPLESSVCSNEPSIGLKLGKRTYFENNNNNKTSSSLLGIHVSLGKKVKPSFQKTTISRCQVEGCNLDLSSSKEYHRKHRVCESHSKSPKVTIAGVERRFCQQCSRFHGMSEFDGEKRSCRRRLSDHNARRRKPPQEPTRFNSSFYDFKESLCSDVGVIDVHRALSLLSNNSWGSSDPNSIMPVLPLSSAEYWQTGHDQHAVQNFKSPYENTFLFHPNG